MVRFIIFKWEIVFSVNLILAILLQYLTKENNEFQKENI